MKKFVVSILISVYFVLPSFSINEHYNEQYLDWATFCPIKYVNSTYREESTRAKSAGLFLTYSIVGMYWGIKLLNEEFEKKEGNYWFLRRRKFQDSLSICNDINDNDNRLKCQLKVRELEDNINNRQDINVYANPSPIFVFW
ncbi:MAG: hypothetical protein GX568_00750 [Candidatus Gastranaerophilales bacterium]|nr:hypothetical protein [Candidatus Gastranaerophilales bacterium]